MGPSPTCCTLRLAQALSLTGSAPTVPEHVQEKASPSLNAHSLGPNAWFGSTRATSLPESRCRRAGLAEDGEGGRHLLRRPREWRAVGVDPGDRGTESACATRSTIHVAHR